MNEKEQSAINYLVGLGYQVIKPLTDEGYLKRPFKSGMYGEIPKVVIGNMELCMMTDKPGETHVWIGEVDAEAGEFYGKPLDELGQYIYKWFSKNF